MVAWTIRDMVTTSHRPSNPSGNPRTGRAARYLEDCLRGLRPMADVYRPVDAVQVDAIKAGVLRDPLGYLDSRPSWDEQIHCGATAATNHAAGFEQLVGRVLIKARSDRLADLRGQADR